MSSIKARKGNPFEYDTAYSLQQAHYTVNRIDDNSKGLDLIAKRNGITFHIECKFHKGFSWNQLTKIFDKTYETSLNISPDAIPIVVFKANQQPVLVMYLGAFNNLIVTQFNSYFGVEWSKRPKGFKLWS